MKLQLVNDVETISSIELVEYINTTRKPEQSILSHRHFIEKLPKVLGLDSTVENSTVVTDAEYVKSNGVKAIRTIAILQKREAMLMAMSYSYELQARVYDAWERLAKKNALSVPDFSNPAEAARAWALQYELAQAAIATKAEIGNRREATAMNTASTAVKKANKLEIELDKSKEYSSIKRMTMLHHGIQFDWRKLKSAGQDLGVASIDIFDQNYGSIKSYHNSVWLEAYALDINCD